MTAPEYLVAAALMPFPEVERIVLFGSRARGDAMPRSDIDLAIACPRADPKIWSDIVEAADEAPTLLQIDLVRTDTAPPELLAEIAREGRVLYERNISQTQSLSETTATYNSRDVECAPS
jgi:predicted nucleotidyltransferase